MDEEGENGNGVPRNGIGSRQCSGESFSLERYSLWSLPSRDAEEVHELDKEGENGSGVPRNDIGLKQCSGESFSLKRYTLWSE